MSEAIKEKIGEELYKQVTEKLGDLKIDIISDNYVPKSRFNEINESKKELERQIGERDIQLKDLSTKATGNDELTKKLNELTEMNTQTKNEYENKIKDINFNAAIEKALTSNNAKYSDLLMSKIDKSKLILNENGVIGLDDQLKTLKEAYKDMFGSTQLVGSNPNTAGSNPTPVSNDDLEVAKVRSAMGLPTK